MSDISDEELNNIIRQILEAFPDFGHCMITGHLRYLGLHIQHGWVVASYLHVHGPPTSALGSQRIQRRTYSVPGVNALWHHDGQHGKFPRF
jgi:hypothetical protein